mgnify:CR=1 FL=1
MRKITPHSTFLCIVLFILVTACSKTAEKSSDSELIRVPYQSLATAEERDYFMYLPKGYHYEPGKKWPLMLFLHGNGERGNAKDELDYVIKHGPLYEAWIQKRDLPFIIIAPQLPMYGMDSIEYIANRTPDEIPKRLDDGVPDRPADSSTPYPMLGSVQDTIMVYPPQGPPQGWWKLEEDILLIVESSIEEFNIDRNRIYLTGLSYGGFGTWYIASKHPEMFAAIAPVVGYGHPELMKPIADENLSVWCFSGGRDMVVPQKYFYPGLNELEKLGHSKLRFTTHEDMGHDTWTRVYGGQDIYDWFLLHELEK